MTTALAPITTGALLARLTTSLNAYKAMPRHEVIVKRIERAIREVERSGPKRAMTAEEAKEHVYHVRFNCEQHWELTTPDRDAPIDVEEMARILINIQNPFNN